MGGRVGGGKEHFVYSNKRTATQMQESATWCIQIKVHESVSFKQLFRLNAVNCSAFRATRTMDRGIKQISNSANIFKNQNTHIHTHTYTHNGARSLDSFVAEPAAPRSAYLFPRRATAAAAVPAAAVALAQ